MLAWTSSRSRNCSATGTYLPPRFTTSDGGASRKGRRTTCRSDERPMRRGKKAEEGLGLEQAVGDEDLDEDAEGDIALPGDESVDGGGEVESLEVVGDGGQGADALGLVSGGGNHGAVLLGNRDSCQVCQERRNDATPSGSTRSRGCGMR